jgi:hypothetical protein
MHDPVILRAELRHALALRPREEFSEGMLKLSIERLLGLKPGALPVNDFQAAVEWNHGEALIAYRWDKDAEANYWRLTKTGKTKEGVK